MSRDLEWDESNALGLGVAYKAIDTSFLKDMEGPICDAEKPHPWTESAYLCIRVGGHTGRHLALEWRCRYPVAVWR